MLIAAICLLVLVMLNVCASEDSCTPINLNIRRIQEYNNKRINESSLWTTDLPMAKCLEKCHLDSQCISVNLNPETEVCIGFQRHFEDLLAQTEAVQGYQLLETIPSFVCTANEYCLTNFDNRNCYENRCRCDIGYSLDGVVCRNLSECVTYSNDYSFYPGFVKWGLDFLSLTNETLESCGDRCISEAACRTADFHPNIGNCWIGDTYWFEGPDHSRGTNTGYIYIQRECSW